MCRVRRRLDGRVNDGWAVKCGPNKTQVHESSVVRDLERHGKWRRWLEMACPGCFDLQTQTRVVKRIINDPYRPRTLRTPVTPTGCTLTGGFAAWRLFTWFILPIRTTAGGIGVCLISLRLLST